MSDDGEETRPRNKNWLDKLSNLLGLEPKTPDQLMEILRDAEERKIISSDMLGMIERILQVSEMQVRDVMVPKAQMVSVQINHDLEKLLPIVIESGHSRFPVFDLKNHEVMGMLLAKDLLAFCFNKDIEEFSLKGLMRPAIFTPQSKRLNILLREFRDNRNHIAIVLDEYGHVAGLITIEDVLEQIVGEIEDEYDIDEEEGQIRQHDDQTFIVKASTLIEEFNQYFHTNFSDTEFDTIGGIVLHGFNHLPKRGESITIDDIRFKVLHSDNRRIYLLEVKLNKKRKENNIS